MSPLFFTPVGRVLGRGDPSTSDPRTLHIQLIRELSSLINTPAMQRQGWILGRGEAPSHHPLERIWLEQGGQERLTRLQEEQQEPERLREWVEQFIQALRGISDLVPVRQVFIARLKAILFDPRLLQQRRMPSELYRQLRLWLDSQEPLQSFSIQHRVQACFQRLQNKLRQTQNDLNTLLQEDELSNQRITGRLNEAQHILDESDRRSRAQEEQETDAIAAGSGAVASTRAVIDAFNDRIFVDIQTQIAQALQEAHQQIETVGLTHQERTEQIASILRGQQSKIEHLSLQNKVQQERIEETRERIAQIEQKTEELAEALVAFKDSRASQQKEYDGLFDVFFICTLVICRFVIFV